MDPADTPGSTPSTPGPGRVRSVLFTSLAVLVVLGLSALGIAAWVLAVRTVCACAALTPGGGSIGGAGGAEKSGPYLTRHSPKIPSTVFRVPHARRLLG